MPNVNFYASEAYRPGILKKKDMWRESDGRQHKLRGKPSRDKQWSDSAKNCRNKMAKKPWGKGKTCVDRWEEDLGHWNDNTTSIPWRVAIAAKFQIPLFTRKMAMEWD